MTASPSTDISRYVADDARRGLREAIAEAGGNEVFFLGRLGEDGRVDEVRALCRGNASAVPALLDVPRSGEAVLHNHPSGHLVPSDADLSLASRYGQDGVAFFIVDNDASRIYCVVEPQSKRLVPVDPERVRALLGAGGDLSRALAGYEARPAQVAMAVEVGRAVGAGGVAVVEAGTGTGKSLAYLVPAAAWAIQNRRRVAVATRTINLQQQLMTQDIPVLRRMLPEVEAALVKGRGNYLCRRKLADRAQDLQLFEGKDREFLEQVVAWSEVTPDGSLADLPFVPDREMWEEVNSSSEETLRIRCPHYERCFYYQSRRRAAASHVLVVNHALLLADLAIKEDSGAAGAGVLPRFDLLVLDEAHHLEDAATSQAAVRVQLATVLRPLSRLKPARERRPGTLGRLRRAVESSPRHDDPRSLAVLSRIDEAMVPSVESLRTLLPMWFQDLAVAAVDAVGKDELDRVAEGRLRLREGVPLPGALDPVLPDRVAEGASALASLARDVDVLRELVAQLPQEVRERCAQSGMELGTASKRLLGLAQAMKSVLDPDPNRCRWLEIDRPRPRIGEAPPPGVFQVRLCSSPIDVSPMIRERLVTPMKATVMTSATLTVDRSFRHFRERVGLGAHAPEAERVSESRYDSPFDYGRQVLLGVPRDVPEPGRPGYPDAVTDLVVRAVQASAGRAFVLFTAYGMLRRVARAAEARLGPSFRILCQGEMDRGRLLDAFRAGGRSVLFGTDSFWEGVDVRGDALSLVVLTRLPFRVPSEPVQQARAEAIESAGGDAFRDYAVPQAVIKLKQGFGRLIRSRTDRGVVLILDPRVITRSYGQAFLRSLPDARPLVAPGDDVVAAVARFLSSPGGGAGDRG
ncbi:DEAD/DEAH box helicase [Myxococcota bacterium]|nr:DEAD/DEAH box helicase [Myxococcota bacterium]